MNKKLTSVLVASSLVFASFSGAAMADTPSFDFVQASKTQLDLDGAFELDGFELKLNKELTADYYLNIDYTDVSEGPADLQLTNIGIGYRSDISDQSAFFAQVDWSQVEYNDGSDDSGYRLSAGVRTQWTPNFEVKAAYEYWDIDDDGSNVFVLGGAYKMTEQLSLTLDYKTESDFDQTSFGVRYSF